MIIHRPKPTPHINIMKLNAAESRSRSTANLAEESTIHHGDLYHAIPEHRDLYVTALVLRVASILLGATITGAAFKLSPRLINYNSSYSTYVYGAPTGIMTLAWGLVDLTGTLIRDRGYLRAAKRRERRKKRGLPATPFSWAPPALHVTVHLAIWVASFVLNCLLWQAYFMQLEMSADSYQYNEWYRARVRELRGDNNDMLLIPTLQVVTVFIHFVLFVLACIATDDKLREYSDVIFVSRDQGKEGDVTTLPSSLWEAVRPRKLPMAVAVNQYVTFVPGEDGTVRVAGEFGNATM